MTRKGETHLYELENIFLQRTKLEIVIINKYAIEALISVVQSYFHYSNVWLY